MERVTEHSKEKVVEKEVTHGGVGTGVSSSQYPAGTSTSGVAGMAGPHPTRVEDSNIAANVKNVGRSLARGIEKVADAVNP